MKVIQSNPGVIQQLINNLKALNGTQGKVGWFESAQYEDGTPVAVIAQIQEFGAPGKSIPPRPFMRPTAIEQQNPWSQLAAQVSKRVVTGKMTSVEAMELLTLKAETDVSKTIAAITQPPLSPITLLARKYRKEGKTVTGKTIGELAHIVKEHDGNITSLIAGISTKPLNDTGRMIATLTHVVTK